MSAPWPGDLVSVGLDVASNGDGGMVVADRSRFDEFGGYYSVLLDGEEMARFAPSPLWSEYAERMSSKPGFSYAWVPNS